MIAFSTSLIRELRGSPLTVLVAILLLDQTGQVPVTAQLLKDVTGYRDHTITDSLRVLESPTRQIVSRVTGGWRLASGFQLPLTFENREYRDSFPVDDVVAVIEETSSSFEEINNNRPQNREYRDSYKAAVAAGIMDPKAGQIARLAWVTPAYINALEKDVKQGNWDNPIGMLIHRIQNHYPASTNSIQSKMDRFINHD